MINQFNWSLADIENMFYWEREIYIQLLNGYIEEKKERMLAEQTSNGAFG